ncbi:hypothetical protein [Oceanimonas baumannii]|uniref:Uncharacterized protein n=1 Tax=Oceanimonas baumannii TaxID=129578 RepID=A0A235CNJ6_9GAMM|nr:hypothetical protein [Oceanimonas baumannii]OYD25425.1 hypothetical protein B6S09_04185 [Oceanimonas baumannii]TDW61380.1 hypothetical protein LY04_00918 [Oceanimonas baumannii]
MTFHSSVNGRVERQVVELKQEIAELKGKAELFSTQPDSSGQSLMAAVERLERKQQALFSELGFHAGGFHLA